MAAKADKYALYEQSVQAPELEVEFVEKTFRKLRGRPPERLREDFSGTACFASEWVSRRASHTAEARDLEPRVLQWARQHHVSKLSTAAAKRLTLKLEDVRVPSKQPFDVVVGYNYSYMTFKTRAELRGYFASVRKSLKRDGLLFLDIFGGPLAQQTSLEPRRLGGGVTYIWDQSSFDPISHDFEAHIHFRFTDGSRIERAFTYQWRLWSIREVRELLDEAGFSKSLVFWEEDADLNRYRVREHVDNDPAWNTYLVGLA